MHEKRRKLINRWQGGGRGEAGTARVDYVHCFQKGGGGLGSLLKEVKKVLKEPSSDVEVVSVYGGCAPPLAASPSLSPAAPPATPQDTAPVPVPVTPSTCVWVSVRDTQGSYMNAVKLQGLLALHTRQVCRCCCYGR